VSLPAGRLDPPAAPARIGPVYACLASRRQARWQGSRPPARRRLLLLSRLVLLLSRSVLLLSDPERGRRRLASATARPGRRGATSCTVYGPYLL